MDSSQNVDILPVLGKRNILITSALPYCNNIPHLGNIIGSVLSADVFARYCKARGYNTLFICGTDEYGTATETKAIEEGITPQELCEKYYKVHKDVYDWFEVKFDIFGRTSTKQQTEISQDIFLKLQKHGYLEEKSTIQPYCTEPKHESFLADRFVEGECPLCHYLDARGDQCDQCSHVLDPETLINPRCKLDGNRPVLRETKHIFLLLDKLQPAIEEWQQIASKEGAWSSNGIHITESWLKEGLRPRGITRDFKWGTAVPLEGYENKVLYVWFDACIGYVSITANYTADWEKWWRDPENVRLYQFLGKDNVPFHTVVFPGTQMGTKDKWTQLHHLSTTEYLKYENGKFSKSRGIGVFGTDAEKTGIPADVWRYYLLSHRPESGDSEFEWKAFIECNNNELLKNFGNLVNRIIKFVNGKNYDSVVPRYDYANIPSFEKWIKDINSLLRQYIEELEAVKLKAGLATVLHISATGNRLLQAHTLDNRLASEQPAKCAAIVSLGLHLVRLLAATIQPYLPATSASICAQLNISSSFPLAISDTFETDVLSPGHKLGTAAYLFSQIKPDMETKWREDFGGDEARRQRQEKAEKAAKKKADKERKKQNKSQNQNQAQGESKDDKLQMKSVEAVDKGGAQALDNPKDALEEISEGVSQTALQTS